MNALAAHRATATVRSLKVDKGSGQMPRPEHDVHTSDAIESMRSGKKIQRVREPVRDSLLTTAGFGGTAPRSAGGEFLALRLSPRPHSRRKGIKEEPELHHFLEPERRLELLTCETGRLIPFESRLVPPCADPSLVTR
jgi:hypothetical protein